MENEKNINRDIDRDINRSKEEFNTPPKSLYEIPFFKKLQNNMAAYDAFDTSLGKVADAALNAGNEYKKTRNREYNDYDQQMETLIAEQPTTYQKLGICLEKEMELKKEIAKKKLSGEQFNQRSLEFILDELVIPLKNQLGEKLQFEKEYGQLPMISNKISDKINSTLNIIGNTNLNVPSVTSKQEIKQELEEEIREEIRGNIKKEVLADPLSASHITENNSGELINTTSEHMDLETDMQLDTLDTHNTPDNSVNSDNSDNPEKPLLNKNGNPLNNEAHIRNLQKMKWGDIGIPAAVCYFLLKNKLIVEEQKKFVLEFLQNGKSKHRLIFCENANVLTTIFYELQLHGFFKTSPKALAKRIGKTFVKRSDTSINLVSYNTVEIGLKPSNSDKRLKGGSKFYEEIQQLMQDLKEAFPVLLLA